MTVAFCYLFVYVLEGIIFAYYCKQLFEAKCSGLKQAVMITAAYCLQFMCSFLHMPSVNTILFIVLNGGLIYCLYDKKLRNILFHSVLLTIAMLGTELLIAPLFAKDFWAEQSSLHNLLVQAPLCKLAYFLMVIMLVHILKGVQTDNEFVTKANMVLIMISMFAFVILYTLMVIYSQAPLTKLHRGMLITDAVIILVFVLAASWIYNYTLKKSEEQAQLEFEVQKEQDCSHYYQSLLKEDEQHRILVHDMKNHLQSMLSLTENGNTERLTEYIRHLLSDYKLLSPIEICDNKIINSICNRYRNMCSKQRISFYADVRKECLFGIPENEITSIVCNLLDNAVEATIHVPEAFVEINIYKRVKFTYITVINTCHMDPFDRNTGRLISRKSLQRPVGILHGLGLKSVEQIAKRHEGELECHFDQSAHEFHVTVSLME